VSIDLDFKIQALRVVVVVVTSGLFKQRPSFTKGSPMALESGTYLNSLNSANPASTDGLAQADDHLRLIKATILASFPGITGAVTSTHTELNVLDGITSTTAELNTLDGFTGTAADLNYAKDLNATGVTATELDVLDGITATTAELNILDGVTATAAELNKLDGINVSTTELNQLSGVQGNIQTQIDNAGGGLLDYAMYTSSSTWAIPSGTKKLVIKASGGGGGGGGLNPGNLASQSGANGGDTTVTQSTLSISITAKGGLGGNPGPDPTAGKFQTNSSGGSALHGGGSIGGNEGGHHGSVGAGTNGGPGSLVIKEVNNPSVQTISFTVGGGGSAGGSSQGDGVGGYVEFWAFG